MSVILKTAIAAAAVAIVGVEILSHRQASAPGAPRPVAAIAPAYQPPAPQQQAAAPPPLRRAVPSPMQMFHGATGGQN